MTIANYSDLLAELNLELARDETSRAPNLIAQVEADLHANRYFRLIDMQTNATLTTTGGTNTVAAPSDILQIDSLFANTSPSEITYMPENQMASLFYDPSIVGRPEFYTIVGSVIKFAPTPDAAYDYTIRYKQKIPALTFANPTNWLLSKNPNVYLHGCAYFFSPKIKDYQQMQMYEALYSRAVQALIDSSTGYEYPSAGIASYTVDR
jgi:hypothetical protein